MASLGIVLPIHVDFSNFGELLPSLQKIKAEAGATHVAQYIKPGVNRDLILGFLNTCEAAGFTAMIGWDWVDSTPPGHPVTDVYVPILSDAAIKGHVALKEVQILDEPRRRGISPSLTKSHYDRMKSLLPDKDLLLAVSNEWGRWPESAAAGLADIIQFACLEHRLNPTTGNCDWQHNDTLTYQKKGREVAISLGYTRMQSTLQGWVGATYCFSPLEDFITEYEVLAGPALSTLPIEKVMIQRWAGRGAGSETREIFFGAPEFKPHRDYLLGLSVPPEGTWLADTVIAYPEGSIVKEDGDYIGLTTVARKEGETFPRSSGGSRVYIQVQKEE